MTEDGQVHSSYDPINHPSDMHRQRRAVSAGRLICSKHRSRYQTVDTFSSGLSDCDPESIRGQHNYFCLLLCPIISNIKRKCRCTRTELVKIRTAYVLLLITMMMLRLDTATGMQPLLGASLTWAISRGFTAGDRKVNLTLTTAFAMSDLCSYAIGSAVSCLNTSSAHDTSSITDTHSSIHTACNTSVAGLCQVAKQHGVLCIGQLIPRRNNVSELEMLYSSADRTASFCVSDIRPGTRVHHEQNATLNITTHFTTPAPAEHLGKVNDFVVTAIYFSPQHDTSMDKADMGTNGLAIAVGSLQHQVQVADDAVALVAWLQPADASDAEVEGYENSILLPPCTGSEKNGAACSVNTDSSEELTWSYWKDFNTSGLPRQHLIQTYVSLCRVLNGSCSVPNTTKPDEHLHAKSTWLDYEDGTTNAATAFTLNYHSPEPSFPLMVQVAASRISRNNSTTSFVDPAQGGQNATTFDAPHAPMYFGAFDADGDTMTGSCIFDEEEILCHTNKFSNFLNH